MNDNKLVMWLCLKAKKAKKTPKTALNLVWNPRVVVFHNNLTTFRFQQTREQCWEEKLVCRTMQKSYVNVCEETQAIWCWGVFKETSNPLSHDQWRHHGVNLWPPYSWLLSVTWGFFFSVNSQIFSGGVWNVKDGIASSDPVKHRRPPTHSTPL